MICILISVDNLLNPKAFFKMPVAVPITVNRTLSLRKIFQYQTFSRRIAVIVSNYSRYGCKFDEIKVSFLQNIIENTDTF